MKRKSLRQLIQQARDILPSISKPRELLIAQEKRAMERTLRAQGYSRAEAVALVSERFRGRGKDA